MDDDETGVVEDVRIFWNKTLPRRVWLRTTPEQLWFLPDPEAALAMMAAADEVTDSARWTRAKARELVGRAVTPLPMPEDATGFFTIAAGRWLNGGWIN